MKRSWSIPVGIALLAISLCMVSGSAVWAQPVYDLSIEGPSQLTGTTEGAVVSAEYTCYLTHSGDAAPSGGSAQGWSISMTADDAAITDIQTGIGVAGDPLTDAAALYDGGFNKSEVTTAARAGSGCEGKNGAVSAVVLSFTTGATLEADKKSSIAVLSVEATIPAQETSYVAKVYYVDGCKGVGQPVDNNVTHDGASVKPSLGETDITVLGPLPTPRGKLALGFSADPVRVVGGDPMTLIDELLGVEGAGGEIEVSGPVGTTPTGTAYVGIVSPYDEAGTDAVQGWSLAVGVDGDGEPVAASLENTAGAPVPDGYYDGGFNKTEIVDPAKEPTSGALAGQGPQGPGVVSAVVLSFTTGATLPKLGVESVLKLDVQATVAIPDGGTVSATLLFKDGLQGIGQPVSNVATVDGGTAQYANTKSADVTLVYGDFVPPVNSFLRGNPNNDGKVNIADPIWIVNELFRGGPATLCQDAADANDDGSVDVSDVTYLIEYEFQGGSMPPAPFPDCGADPEGDDDGVTCEVTQDICE